MNSKYRKMIGRLEMRGARRRGRGAGSGPWHLYMLRCSDGRLYTGIAKDMRKRLTAHQAGKGARFTRVRLPVELVYQEACGSRSAALIREFRIKSLSRKRKDELISGS